MSSVNNVGNNSPVYSANRTGPKPPVQSPPATSIPVRGKDSVELSGGAPVANATRMQKASGGVRADLVASVKARIAAGTYETDKKFDAATDKLLDDVLKP